MTPEQRAKRIHKIVYSCDDRAELAERIVALEYENAKMQELMSESRQANEKLLAELRRYKSIVHARYSQPVAKLMEENAKLRELVSDTLMDTNDYAHKYGLPEHDWKAVNNHLNDRMQELGVEVGND